MHKVCAGRERDVTERDGLAVGRDEADSRLLGKLFDESRGQLDDARAESVEPALRLNVAAAEQRREFAARAVVRLKNDARAPVARLAGAGRVEQLVRDSVRRLLVAARGGSGRGARSRELDACAARAARQKPRPN